jgi:hypothetical protein
VVPKAAGIIETQLGRQVAPVPPAAPDSLTEREPKSLMIARPQADAGTLHLTASRGPDKPIKDVPWVTCGLTPREYRKNHPRGYKNHSRGTPKGVGS